LTGIEFRLGENVIFDWSAVTFVVARESAFHVLSEGLPER
jgi:hypothetical protein